MKAFKLRGVSKDKRKELESEAVPCRHFRNFAGTGAESSSKEIFLAMDHPHVASLVDVYESDEQLFLVMDALQKEEGLHREVCYRP